MIFTNYDELTTELVDRVEAAIADRTDMHVKRGFSNQSCSAYVNVEFVELDEDGDVMDILGDCKVRFSDHADRYGSDLSIRFDDKLDSDEHGNVDLADWRMDEMVSEAVAFIAAEQKEQVE